MDFFAGSCVPDSQEAGATRYFNNFILSAKMPAGCQASIGSSCHTDLLCDMLVSWHNIKCTNVSFHGCPAVAIILLCMH